MTSRWLALVLVAACASAAPVKRYERTDARRALVADEGAGLVIGTFPLPPDAVVDGDTIRVRGLDQSLRLLAIDTEETFRTAKDRSAFASGWDAYYALMQGDDAKPAKMATPMGEKAKQWAKDFFAGVDKVRLERDDPRQMRGYFGRYLAYAFANKDGRWVNYNVEAVRAGMSPYFTKYGYSKRFHDELVAAEKEAREAGRGVWDPAEEHYRDYELRQRWWNARAKFLEDFDKRRGLRSDHVALTEWNSLSRIAGQEGQYVTLVGQVSNIRRRKAGVPVVVNLSRQRGQDFPWCSSTATCSPPRGSRRSRASTSSWRARSPVIGTRTAPSSCRSS